jgi:hypothetical protein
VHVLVALAVVRFGLTLSLGTEYDTNANRAEVTTDNLTPDTPTPSFLLRTTAQAGLTWRKGANLLRTSFGGGGKVYFNPEVFDQDVLVVQAGLDDRVRVARFLHLSIAGEYYDAWQLDYGQNRHFDFRNGWAVLRTHFVDRVGEVTFSGGFRGFEYKPNSKYDFDAAQANASAITRIHFGTDDEHELDLYASYHVERRFFSSLRDSAQQADAGPGDRRDWFHEGGLELTYVGPLLALVGYSVQLNLSNSFGQSLLRNIVTLKVAYRFPWSLYATAKAQIYFTQYLDSELLTPSLASQTFITIEDENRNNVIVDLERPIRSTGLAVIARYSVFTNELSPNQQTRFLRQVIYLGLTYRLGPR